MNKLLIIIKLVGYGLLGVGLTSGDIYFWELPFYVCLLAIILVDLSNILKD